MAKKGKFWKNIFKEKEQEETAAEGKAKAKDEAEGKKKAPAEELKVEELPRDECRFCYNNFNSGQEVYKCPKCETYYHFPKCLKNQSSCRVCGEKLVEFGNIVKLIKFRSVVCPKCGMKIKLFYGTEPKLNISCPSCAHEGLLPNPYLKGKKQAEESEAEEEIEEAVEGTEVEAEAEGEVEEGEEIDIELEPESESKPEGKGELKDAEGPKVIKEGKSKKRKAKLVVLEQSITCNVCLGTVKTGLPVVVCKCGKKYHESCAQRVGECPTCDAGLRDYERLIEEELEISDEDLEAISKPKTEEVVEAEAEPEPELEPEPEVEPKPEPKPEPEPKPDPRAEFKVKLNKHNTFDDYTVNDNNRIVYSIANGIAKAPGLEFRLVYLYGSHGLGKTHLLHAIGNHLKNNNPKLKVRYTSTSAFFSKLDSALEKKMKKDFEDYYNEADIFLLDDLHEIPKNKQTQDIFVKIFDNLVENNKQILVTGDRSIEEIKNLNKNLAKKLISKSGIIINLFESQL